MKLWTDYTIVIRREVHATEREIPPSRKYQDSRTSLLRSRVSFPRAESEAGKDSEVEWMDEAACVGMDSDIFVIPDYVELAKEVCGECTVRKECLQYGVKLDAEGVYGGTTYEERTPMRRSLLDGQISIFWN